MLSRHTAQMCAHRWWEYAYLLGLVDLVLGALLLPLELLVAVLEFGELVVSVVQLLLNALEDPSVLYIFSTSEDRWWKERTSLLLLSFLSLSSMADPPPLSPSSFSSSAVFSANTLLYASSNTCEHLQLIAARYDLAVDILDHQSTTHLPLGLLLLDLLLHDLVLLLHSHHFLVLLRALEHRLQLLVQVVPARIDSDSIR